MFRFGGIKILSLLGPYVVFIIPQNIGVTLNTNEGEAKMTGNVKNPKVPHQWGEVGRVLFGYNEIELFPRAKPHIFSKQHFSQLKAYGRRNLVSGTLSPHTQSHTYVCTYIFTDLKT